MLGFRRGLLEISVSPQDVLPYYVCTGRRKSRDVESMGEKTENLP